MATTTRSQAEAQHLNEQDLLSLDNSEGEIQQAMSREEERKQIQDETGWYPMFFVTENVPKQVS